MRTFAGNLHYAGAARPLALLSASDLYLTLRETFIADSANFRIRE
jgi:hypothetical protein